MPITSPSLERVSPVNLDVAGDQCVWLPTDIVWPPDQDEIPAEAMKLIEDPGWCAQVKEDGNHVIAARTQDKLTFRNRKGAEHPVPTATAKALMGLLPNTMLDGEKLHEGGYVIFDAMYVGDRDIRDLPYSDRMTIINTEVLALIPDCITIRFVQTAVLATSKLALVTLLRQMNAEGVIFKSLRAPYRPGRPETGGPMRRLKFLKSLTCVVQRRRTDNKASFEMFVFDKDKKPVNIGQVSAQQFFSQIEPGAAKIAEVTYLYATPGNKLTQPRLVRPVPWRDDKSAEECTLDQLIQGGRFAGNKA